MGGPRAIGSPRRISKEEARAFKERWAKVNAAEREELRVASADLKLRQLAALMASAEQMEWTEELKAEEADVRERWMRLRRAYDG